MRNLDLYIGAEGSSLTWQLFQKPLAKHLYVPAISSHPRRIFQGVVEGLVHRCVAKCKHFCDARRHIDFYARKCRDRGYSSEVVRAAVAKQLRKHRKEQLEIFHVRLIRPKAVSFYCKYSGDSNSTFIRSLLRIFPDSCRPRLTIGVQKNVFRLLHRHNWPR